MSFSRNDLTVVEDEWGTVEVPHTSYKAVAKPRTGTSRQQEKNYRVLTCSDSIGPILVQSILLGRFAQNSLELGSSFVYARSLATHVCFRKLHSYQQRVT